MKPQKRRKGQKKAVASYSMMKEEKRSFVKGY